jgi:hypothetical protein
MLFIALFTPKVFFIELKSISRPPSSFQGLSRFPTFPAPLLDNMLWIAHAQ